MNEREETVEGLRAAVADARAENVRLRMMLDMDGREVVRTEIVETKDVMTLTVTVGRTEVDEQEVAARVLLALRTMAPVTLGLTEGMLAARRYAIGVLEIHDEHEAATMLREAFVVSKEDE